jgi:hypothetical protein
MTFVRRIISQEYARTTPWRTAKKTIPHFSISRPIIEGGFHHCQVDDATIGIHTMWDWIADALNAGG